ncbi:uncharacterized protein BJ171DRAFT_496302 [Polychytrium aggregatum]|uniref:uncharacterized protein n=1 Tax=Polychytrium aggregatum TaxID=110093 RepID=UPI0022FDB4CB|nr:uncharacterized protein BJ171DRAFT_496302 [Polychytrium aggregatum]KAI9206600.1 hypothetical protein BJ171DRAFT_496302 [Polychytrium aggregatum]
MDLLTATPSRVAGAGPASPARPSERPAAASPPKPSRDVARPESSILEPPHKGSSNEMRSQPKRDMATATPQSRGGSRGGDIDPLPAGRMADERNKPAQPGTSRQDAARSLNLDQGESLAAPSPSERSGAVARPPIESPVSYCSDSDDQEDRWAKPEVQTVSARPSGRQSESPKSGYVPYPMNSATLSGSLAMYDTATMKGWINYHVVLAEGYLWLYSHKASRAHTTMINVSRGIVELGIQPENAVQRAGPTNPNVFTIRVTPKRRLLVCAPSQTEMWKWLEALGSLRTGRR